LAWPCLALLGCYHVDTTGRSSQLLLTYFGNCDGLSTLVLPAFGFCRSVMSLPGPALHRFLVCAACSEEVGHERNHFFDVFIGVIAFLRVDRPLLPHEAKALIGSKLGVLRPLLWWVFPPRHRFPHPEPEAPCPPRGFSFCPLLPVRGLDSLLFPRRRVVIFTRTRSYRSQYRNPLIILRAPVELTPPAGAPPFAANRLPMEWRPKTKLRGQPKGIPTMVKRTVGM